MYINSNYGNMPHYGNQPSLPSPFPMPRVINDHKMPSYGNMPGLPSPYPMPIVIPDHRPKGGIIPNFHAPKSADTINYFGNAYAPDTINYFGSQNSKTYTLNSFDRAPAVYNMVDVVWDQPVYPQPIYHPKAMPTYQWGAK
jgi:hypothetical protein